MIGRNNLNYVLTEIIENIEYRLTAGNSVTEESHLFNRHTLGYVEKQNGKYKHGNKTDDIPLTVSAPTALPLLNRYTCDNAE